jgi:hypothetical protein
MNTATIVKTRLALALSAFGFELRLWQESHDGQWAATIGDGEQVFHCRFEEENLTLAKLHLLGEARTRALHHGDKEFPSCQSFMGSWKPVTLKNPY